MHESTPEAPDTVIRAERELRDREARVYDEGPGSRPAWEARVHDVSVDSLLGLESHHTLLDAGAGTGRRIPQYLKLAARVIAVDHSEASLDIARERTPPEDRPRLETIAGDLREIPVADATADRELCLGVIQHIPTHEFRLQAVRELWRCLKPGGRLVFVGYRWLGHVKRHKEGYWTPELYRYAFTIPELGELLRNAGFVDLKLGGLVVLPRLSEPLGMSPEAQRRLVFTPLGRLLGHYVLASATRPGH